MQNPSGPYFVVRCESCSRPQIYLTRKKYVKRRTKTCPFCGKSFTIHLEHSIAGFKSQKLARAFLLKLTNNERRKDANSGNISFFSVD